MNPLIDSLPSSSPTFSKSYRSPIVYLVIGLLCSIGLGIGLGFGIEAIAGLSTAIGSALIVLSLFFLYTSRLNPPKEDNVSSYQPQAPSVAFSPTSSAPVVISQDKPLDSPSVESVSSDKLNAESFSTSLPFIDPPKTYQSNSLDAPASLASIRLSYSVTPLSSDSFDPTEVLPSPPLLLPSTNPLKVFSVPV